MQDFFLTVNSGLKYFLQYFEMPIYYLFSCYSFVSITARRAALLELEEFEFYMHFVIDCVVWGLDVLFSHLWSKSPAVFAYVQPSCKA